MQGSGTRVDPFVVGSLQHANSCERLCRDHADAANPGLLHLLAQVLYVTCDDKMLRLSDQQPDPSLHQPYTTVELGRLKTCKQLLLAMEVQPRHFQCDVQALVRCTAAWHMHSTHAACM